MKDRTFQILNAALRQVEHMIEAHHLNRQWIRPLWVTTPNSEMATIDITVLKTSAQPLWTSRIALGRLIGVAVAALADNLTYTHRGEWCGPRGGTSPWFTVASLSVKE